LKQEWLVEMARRLARKLPILMGLRMGLAAVFRPRTRNWKRTSAALNEYIAGQNAKHEASLSLGEGKRSPSPLGEGKRSPSPLGEGRGEGKP
jgi:heterodisulfide reductase subunit C